MLNLKLSVMPSCLAQGQLYLYSARQFLLYTSIRTFVKGTNYEASHYKFSLYFLL